MIRFCDKEVCCVGEELNRQDLIAYFLNGHRQDIICIIDNQGKYRGKITYDSLLGKDLEDSINREYLILDENIWENGRKYFSKGRKEFGGLDLLPVLDKEDHLLCFAWQDDEANRELRMLDELMECRGALGFQDLYPEYDCVVVNGCNELAYFFMQYLRKTGVPVYVSGELWKSIGLKDIPGMMQAEEILDYKRFVVYSEGLEPQKERIEQRCTVSAEFECVDLIYEENIRRGLIGDTAGDFQRVLDKIREKQVVVIGTGEDSLNAYNLLLEYRIDICCFVSEKEECQGNKLFGKSVCSRADAAMQFQNIVFINASYKYSAWGFGDTDYYHYIGYKRNESFILLQDYIEIPKRGLSDVLVKQIKSDKQRLVLLGDILLCLKLCTALGACKNGFDGRIVYCDLLKENTQKQNGLLYLNEGEICDTDICLLLMPKWYGCFSVNNGHIISLEKIMKDRYYEKISKNGNLNVVDYSLENFIFLKDTSLQHNNLDSKFRVREILLGSIYYMSGNIFFKGIIDNHPEVVLLQDEYLNSNLFSICNQLAMVKRSGILSLFWKLFNEYCEWNEEEKAKFSQYMKEMLEDKDDFSSQELFVILHISYARMMGRDIGDISNLVIYWEPHNVSRTILEDYAEWLNGICNSGYIINVLRNTVIRDGSMLNFTDKIQQRLSHSGKDMFREMLFCRNIDKEYDGWTRLIFRFEDIKCNPKKELERLCDALGITWSDTLLETTKNGVKSYYGEITGFDLAPVYRTYEEYFSAFDRFRLSLITGAWQKKYGYPYVNSLVFSRRELDKMFAKDFRFEAKLKFSNDEEKIEFQRWKWKIVSDYLWMERKMEICELIANKTEK